MQKKKLRTKRYEEILRAQGKIGQEIEARGGTEKRDINTLPIKQIKTDLAKTMVFAISSIILILTLHYQGIGYKEVMTLFGK